MESQSSYAAMGAGASQNMVDSEAVIEAPTTVADSGTSEVSEPLLEQSKPGISAPDVIGDSQGVLASEVAT